MAKFAVQVVRPSSIVTEFIIEATCASAAVDEAGRRAKIGDCVWKPCQDNVCYKSEVVQLPWK